MSKTMSGCHIYTTNELKETVYWYRIKKAFSIGSVYYPVGAIRLFTDVEAIEFETKMDNSGKMQFKNYLEPIYERY